MGSIIDVASGTTSEMLAYVGQLFTDLSPIIVLVIGLPLAFWAVRKVISLVRAR